MTHRYFFATTVLVLDQVTPVIRALFGRFNLRPAPPGKDEPRIATNPTWKDILKCLTGLADELAICPAEGAFDNMPSALLLLSAHFHTFHDAALVDLIEHHRFEGDADLDTLFVIATRFDDGHGLKAIRFDAGPYQANLAHSAGRLANEALDLVSDLLPVMTDEATLNPLRKRLANLLMDAASLVEPDSDPDPRH